MFGRESGAGFTGCEDFGFRAQIEGHAMSIVELVLSPFGCELQTADVEELFLTTFEATTSWTADGDRLTLSGTRGDIGFVRELPAVGDPGRVLAEALQADRWQIIDAPGVSGLADLSPVVFGDRSFGGTGSCGYSGRIMFKPGAGLEIREVGWDSIRCPDPRTDRSGLARALESVVSGRVEPDGSVLLSGSRGSILLEPITP